VDDAGIFGGRIMSESPGHDQSVQIVHGVLEPCLSAKLEARVTADATATQGDKPHPIWRMSAYPVRGLAGLTVHIAARVCALGCADAVMATRTVRDLAIGSMLAFEPCGHHDLKGVPGRWPVFSATDPASRR
jgi:hypothetical protein